MWANMRPTPGAFSICTEMSGSGPRTGTQAAYPTGNPVVDPTGPASGSHRVNGVVPGPSTVRTCVLLSAAQRPRAPAHTPLASVLVSKSSSKGAMYGRMTDIADKGRRSGAGLDQRGGSPKGPCQARGARGVNSHPELPFHSPLSSRGRLHSCHREG